MSTDAPVPAADPESSPPSSKKIKVEHKTKDDGTDKADVPSSSSPEKEASPAPKPAAEATSPKSGSGSDKAKSEPAPPTTPSASATTKAAAEETPKATAAATASSSSSSTPQPAAAASSLPPPPPLPSPTVNSSPLSPSVNATPVTQNQITRHDVLLGRGGGTNKHVGNIAFRNLVCEHQPAYVQSRKKDKSIIAKQIVAQIRNLNGRFLKIDPNGDGSGTVWVDVGDKRATEKTSQALREGLSGRMRDIVNQSGKGLKQLKSSGLVGNGSKKGILDQEVEAAVAGANVDQAVKKTEITASKQDKEKGETNGAGSGDGNGGGEGDNPESAAV